MIVAATGRSTGITTGTATVLVIETTADATRIVVVNGVRVFEGFF
jgi:hypothetical protein